MTSMLDRELYEVLKQPVVIELVEAYFVVPLLYVLYSGARLSRMMALKCSSCRCLASEKRRSTRDLYFFKRRPPCTFSHLSSPRISSRRRQSASSARAEPHECRPARRG